MRQRIVRQLHGEGVPLAEIAAKVRKTPEVQSWIDEENLRRGKADLKNPQTATVNAAGNRWNPWQGTPGPK